jgi:hypothetical protein
MTKLDLMFEHRMRYWMLRREAQPDEAERSPDAALLARRDGSDAERDARGS